MMMLELLVVPALIVWAVISLSGAKRLSAHDDTPLEILRRRYASGELDEAAFERARSQLA